MSRRLLGWYAEHRRVLPWRERPGPYRTWLSEVMLQQTRVETVIPRFERFLARFPTVEALAAADLDEVLEEWAGLGYYARARNLHAAARMVVAEGGMPTDVAGLRRLPGVGRYVAGAIASIAMSQDEVAIDGNADRVLRRLFAWDGGRAGVEALARALLPAGRAADFNQALMDLGSAVCLPRNPRCSDCPLVGDCRAAETGEPERYPKSGRRRTVPTCSAVGLVVRRRGLLLLGRRPVSGLFGGLYELPGVIGEPGDDRDGLGARALATHFGLEPTALVEVGGVRHTLTHLHLHLHLLALPGDGRRPPPRPRATFYTAFSWVDPARPTGVALSTLASKALAVVSGGEAPGAGSPGGDGREGADPR
ncbi:MAG: A/G-specific adenine glycosylase [Deltaproteobacteria bacterium]|nr:MAG: A/G-specific adenine glycosylase [Deltaproteobacteria bacterium]